jgi:hypothetical protein
LTNRYSPPPSLSLKGISRAFAPEITAFVSILGVTPFGDDLLPPLLTPTWGLAVNGCDQTAMQQKYRENQGISALCGSLWTLLDDEMVAREGIEPPTRGFSVRCSTN